MIDHNKNDFENWKKRQTNQITKNHEHIENEAEMNAMIDEELQKLIREY